MFSLFIHNEVRYLYIMKCADNSTIDPCLIVSYQRQRATCKKSVADCDADHVEKYEKYNEDLIDAEDHHLEFWKATVERSYKK